MRTVVFPGTFDPITRGHLDVIARAARLFDRVIVAVGAHPDKAAFLSLSERLDLIRAEVRRMSNVEVRSFDGLLVDFVTHTGACAVLRGIRGAGDTAYEMDMADTNRVLRGVETLFLSPRPELRHVSASRAREIAALGGDLRTFVTPRVARRLRARRPAKAGRP